MKKILVIAALALVSFANAQTKSTSEYKPSEGTVTTEVGLTGGLNNADFNLNTGVLKFRYFLKDDLGLRLGLATNSSKVESKDATTPSNVITYTNKTSNFVLNLGVEKHFAGSDRLSTYAGADLLIGFGGAKGDAADQSGNSYSVEGATINIATGNPQGNANNSFGVRLLTGADYYIAKKVYLGVEAGLNILSGKTKEIVETTKAGSTTTTVTTPAGKNSGITTNVIGGIRLGFQF